MSRIEKTATVITILILLSNVIGYVRELLLANFFGASYVIDAYLMAQSIAFILFTGIMSAIATSFVPLYSNENEINGFQSGNRFTSGVVNLVTLLTLMLAILGLLFAEPVVSFIAYGFSGQAHILTVHYVRIGFIVAAIFSVNEIVKTFLHCNDGFTVEKLSGFSVNIFLIIFIILSSFYQKEWLMYGYLLGYSTNLLLCIYFARSKGFRFSFTFPEKSVLKQILTMVLPVFIGSAAGQINNLVEKFLASGLHEGSVSYLGYAGTVNNMLMTLGTAAILLVIYPQLSNQIAQNDLAQFKKTFTGSLDFLIIILVPLTFGTIALAVPGVSVLYERGQFGSADVIKTAGVLICLSIGMIGFGLNSIISKAYYSFQDSKTPMLIGFISIIINIVASLLLIGRMGVYGLALATSLAALFSMVPNAWLLKRKIGGINYRYSLVIFIKSAAASIIMGAAAYGLYYFITDYLACRFIIRLIVLIAAILVGIVIYTYSMRLMKVKEVSEITRRVKNAFVG